MASKKVKTLEEAHEEVLNICKKYNMNVLDSSVSYTKNGDWQVLVHTDCDDDEVYDKVYTRCGFMNEERCLKDLTVSLE